MDEDKDYEEKDYTVSFYFWGIEGRIKVPAPDTYNAVKRVTIRLQKILKADTFQITDVEE
jgi:hypothetical protein